MKKQLLILTTFFTALVGYSQTFNALDNNGNTLEFDITSATTVSVTDYISGGTDVDIPTTVSNASVIYNVTGIGELTFFNKQLTSVIIPNSVTAIEWYAFATNNLTDVIIPDSITMISEGCFQNNLLTNITIPNTVTSIGIEAFTNNQLVNVLLPSNLVNIDIAAFSGNQLTNIAFPNSVSNIGIAAFSGNQLTTVTIPSNITTIENDTFRDNLLTTISVPNAITSIGDHAFQNNQLANANLGDGIITIGAFAFESNQLTDFTIPESVTNMGSFVFGDNPITTFISLAIIPPAIASVASQNDTFGNLRGNIDLHIPVGTLGAYVTGAGAQWTGFNSVTEDSSLSNSEFILTNNIKAITTTNEIKIVSPDSLRLENYTIYNISGAKVKQGTETTIAIEAIANGIYILKLTFDKGTITKKVVLK